MNKHARDRYRRVEPKHLKYDFVLNEKLLRGDHPQWFHDPTPTK